MVYGGLKMGTKGEVSSMMNSMDTATYTTTMGGTVSGGTTTDNFKNTGVNSPHSAVNRYFNILYNYYCNRYEYHSKILSQQELRLIEHYLFYRNSVAFVYPRFRRGKEILQINTPRVYPFNITAFNTRNLEPTRINIIGTGNTDGFNAMSGLEIDTVYNASEFEIITDKYNYRQAQPTPQVIAWEFANKLYEYDLMFNANSTKQRLPIIFNNGAKSTTYSNAKGNKDKTYVYQFIQSVAETIRGAFDRQEQFAEISEDRVGDKGVMHEVSQENRTLEYLEGQDKLYNQYLELIGISPVREQTGVYVNKEIQTDNVQTTDYKTYVGLRNRQVCLNRINERFNLDITVEAWDNKLDKGMEDAVYREHDNRGKAEENEYEQDN